MQRMGYTKRQANSKSKVFPQDFKDIKEQYLFDIKSIVLMEDIPQEMILNWDLVGMKIIPSSAWTMEKSGIKRAKYGSLCLFISWVIPSYSADIPRNYCKMSAEGGQISRRDTSTMLDFIS